MYVSLSQLKGKNNGSISSVSLFLVPRRLEILAWWDFAWGDSEFMYVFWEMKLLKKEGRKGNYLTIKNYQDLFAKDSV